MSEEIEVKVRQIDGGNEKTTEAMPIVDLMRRLLLASIGAVALTYDETERNINRLVDRGELAQKDGEKILSELVGRFGQIQQQQKNIGGQLEGGFEQFLNSINVPSKRDIDDLSAKLSQLAARVEELRRTQQ